MTGKLIILLKKIYVQFRDHTIFTQLFLSFVTTSLLIIIISTIFYYNYAIKSTERQVKLEIEDTLQQSIALLQRGYLAPIDSSLSMMEMSPSLNNFLRTPYLEARFLRFDIEKQYAQLISLYPHLYHSIRFVDGFGDEKVIVDNGRRVRTYSSLIQVKDNNNLLLSQFFKELKQSKSRETHYSKIFISKDGHPHFYAGIALLEPEIGGFGGTVIFECDLSEYIEQVKALKFNGLNIVSISSITDTKLLSAKVSAEDELINHNIHAGTALSLLPFLKIQMRIPVSILAEQKMVILKTALLIGWLAIMAIFIVAWFLSKKISQPVTKLVDASKRLSDGEFIPVDVKGGRGELSLLSTAFNVMGSQLDSTIKSRNQELAVRIQAEEALHRSHEELQLILNSTSEGIYGVNREGICTFCNHAALDILAYKNVDELVGKNIHERILSPNSASLVSSFQGMLLDKVINHGESIHRDNESFCRSDGESFPVEFRAKPVVRGKENIGMVITFTDMTDAHLMEETIRRTQKMDALGKLTGGIAHDFNNLLGIILGYGELLEMELQNNEQQSLYITQINNAGERARKLTSNLLAFSRKQSSVNEETDINRVLNESKHLLETTLTPKIKLVLKTQSDLWSAWLDKSYLEDAILNMSINAMHAMPDGGDLIITTLNEHLSEEQAAQLELTAGDYVTLSLKDSGQGMDAETKHKVFDPFFTTKEENGTGLGLSQVYGFVKQSGGSISLVSEPDKGTCFTLYFLRSKTVKSIKPLKSEKTDLDTESIDATILIVDDEEALRNLMCVMLTDRGYHVLLAESGKQALELLKQHEVNILLSDVIMPEMTGYELAHHVMKDFPEVKIQMISGYSDASVLNDENEILYNNRLVKPCSSALLLQRMSELLDE